MLSNIRKVSFCFAILYYVFAIVQTTNVRQCSGNKPFPLRVDVHGCDKIPCDIIKGGTTIFEIQFVAQKDFLYGKTLVKATALGKTVPYQLPEKVRDVCSNLMFGAYCPLYPTEDATYLFVFPIGNYPEISVKTEIYIVNQNKDVVACFVCDIKVKKGNAGGENSTIYQLDWTA